jgi:hypothetical protein
MGFGVTFNKIPVTSWRAVLLVEQIKATRNKKRNKTKRVVCTQLDVNLSI